MKRIVAWIIAAAVVLSICYCTWQHFSGGGGAEKNEGPVARVQVAQITRKGISEKLVAYGSVVAQPGKTHSVSVAFETRVRHVLVAPGEFVKEGDPVTEVEPSAAAQLQLQQARSAAETSQRALNQIEGRFNLKLATNQDLDAAKKAAADAQAQLSSLERAGAGGDHRVRSDTTGIIAKVDVQDGQIVPVGGPLVEIVAEDEIEVKLGVEPEDLPALHPRQPITIFPVNNPEQGQVEGSVRLITRRVDPATRLVDVYVALPPGTKMMLDGFVRAEFERVAENVLVVPRSAVLPNEKNEYELFTVENGRAHQHAVKVGLENQSDVEVSAPDLSAGQAVVTLGNYELEDGMALEIEKSK
ncbi:MAG: efflux RND transporter periplasmic adaptor subunit [Verrucomicrobia bacterium]|nr:efflux RND transporter periplasmic adaptor subunit [Verrucomicrobiota bacterium]